MRKPLLRSHRLGVGLTVCAMSGAALAQQADVIPGPDFFLDFATGLVASDNFDGLEDPSGDTLLWQTDLVLGFDTATGVDRFSARLGGTLETGFYADDVEPANGVVNPFLSVAYGREGVSSAIAVDLSFRQRDNGFEDFSDAVTGTDLIIDQGIRQDALASIGLELGRGEPVGLTFAAEYSDRRYFDTTDPDLTDEIRSGAKVDLRFALTRTADLLVTAAYDLRDEDDAAETIERNWYAGLGLGVEVNPSLRLRLGLNHAVNEVEETVAGSRVTDRQEGPTFRFSLEQDRPNGTISLNASSELGSTGTQSSLTLGRSLELRTGTLSGTIGATRTAEGEVRGIGSLAWVQEMRTGTVAVDFSQSVTTNDDEQDELNTRLGVRYDRPLSSVDAVRFAFDVARSDELSDTGSDTSRTSVEVAYVRELTADWSLNTGYRYSTSRESGRDDITENRVFAKIDRTFSLRP